MKMKVLLITLFAMSPCAFSKDMVVFLKPEQSAFTVQLKSNPTTGYRWSLQDFNKAIFSLQQSTYQQSQPVLIGSGGYQMFSIKIKHPKKVVDEWMTFKYSRSWEKKASLKQRVHVMTQKSK